MILKIHGCSGAGKTTAVRSLIDTANEVEYLHAINNKRKAIGYRLSIPDLKLPVFVLGSYENNCGGVDTISTAQEVMEMIDRYQGDGHVVHEGLLQSTYYGAMGEHSKRYAQRYIYAFLDTPLHVCLDRIVARRSVSGRANKFNPQLTKNKFVTIQRLEKKLRDEGQHVVATLNYEKPMDVQLVTLLEPA